MYNCFLSWSAYSFRFELPFLKRGHQMGFRCCLDRSRQVGGRHPGGSGGSKMNRGFPERHFALSILRM